MDGKLRAILIMLFVLVGFDSYAQSCTITSKANDIVPDKLCAPVTVTWDVIYRGVNDGGTGNVKMQFDWNDGSAIQTIDATLTDPALNEWSASHNHVYPIGGNECNYHPTVSLVVDDVVCTSTVQEQIVTVWDTDDKNGGEISIDPRVFPICVGNSGSVTFMDNSQWNCVPPDENDQPNDRKRWIQWIYGTNNSAGNFIDNARVNGSVRAYPYSGSIDETFEPILAPTTPWNEALPIFVPDDRVVGDEFEVTLNNWNYCNPYDQGYDPVQTTAVIVIVDDPNGSITPAGPFCEYDAPVILNPVTPGGQWSGPGITNEWTGEFDPSMAKPGIHTITYYVEDGNACSATGSITIEVWDSPLADISTGPEAHLCPGTQLQLNGNPSQGQIPYTHNWSEDTTPLSNTSIVDPTFESIIEGNFELVYRVTDNRGCFDEDTVNIIVDSVSIQFLNQQLTLCTDVAKALEPNPTGGSGTFVFHQWDGDRTDLLSSTSSENPVFESSSPGLFKYAYMVRDSYGCEDIDSVYVNVYEQPLSKAGSNDTACGLEYTLDATPSVGIGEWSLVAGAGAVDIADIFNPKSTLIVDSYGSYTFRWTENNNECIDVSDVTITFYQIPQPGIMNDADTCSLTYPLRAIPDMGIGIWKNIDGPSSGLFDNNNLANTNVNVSQAGMYQFAWVENNNGCIAGDTLNIEFYPIPSAEIAPFNNESCSPITLPFTNTSSNADTYFWDFGDGYISNQSNPTHTFTNNSLDPIDYEIELVASNNYGCVDTGRFDLSVLPTPLAQFQNNEEPACSPLELLFTNQSEGATDYEWQFGDGETSSTESPSHTFSNEEHYVQSFKVMLVANNTYGCKDTLDKFVTVYPLVSYNFTTSPLEGCHPLKTEILADPGAYSYLWHFGDGQSLDGSNKVSHTFENTESSAKEVTIKLITSSVFGCQDSSETIVTVHPSPISSFKPNLNEGCSPFTADLTNLSSGATSSSWFFGDGSETLEDGSDNIQHTYVNSELSAASFQTKLVVENSAGCKDSSFHYLNVYPKVTASISDGGTGCTPYSESLLNNSIGANQFLWDFGDGNTSSAFNGHNTFVNSTLQDKDYEVELIAQSSYGCSDTSYTNVSVFRRPTPSFSLSPKEMQMPESTVNIQNLTQGNDWDYFWKFGDMATSLMKNPGSHTYGVSGEYEVWLKVNGEECSDSAMQIVSIYPTLPALDYGPNAEGCPPLKVQFYNNTIDAHTYFWDFGDGNVSSEKEPAHTYHTSGNYKVKLMAEGPGGLVEADNATIKVYDTPLADFEVRPTLVKLPETVSFINHSERATSYLWNFGDGETSTEHSIQYLYKKAGVYDVTLMATNDLGCTDEHTIREAAIVEEAGAISFPNAFTPSPSGSSGGEYTPGSSDNFVFYPFNYEGIVEYQLRIFTRWGELIFESKDINIGWDGYHRGKICQGGVYIWKVNCRYSNGNIETQTGDVTLFR
ncbi:PKD domain-containing protein [Carboxylicivirga sp. M1479]|uniref:PKD domain-containing protein n=1 Tax=Carboxylicivirga sp. M1479 TaxID=2594476 RepID=UPI001178444A|nr:PKD domain-containing protein [Carboxylicivirga sp. M1479]TRX70837.1 PKD domain-containing protein [Carboxylicivirga sp. M1479]